MKIKDYEEICSYQSDNFKEWFGDMDFEETIYKLYSKVLDVSMNDEQILKGLNPSEIYLGQMFGYLKNKANKNHWMIFYIKDKSGVLRAVQVYWSNGGWNVNAYSVVSQNDWYGGDRVFSVRPFEIQSINHSDTLTLEKAIEICKENGLTVSKNY